MGRIRNGVSKLDATSRAIKDMLQFNTKKLILPENYRISPIPSDDW